MPALLAATLIWSFSFGIINSALADLPGDWVAVLRLGLAAAVFLPLARRRPLMAARPALLGIGAIQFGLMYVLYLESYAALDAWEVALFTAFTPVWVALLTRRIEARVWAAVVACVVGAWILRADPTQRPDFGRGFLLVQAANLCFAFGQVAYRRVVQGGGASSDVAAHAWLFVGGLGAAAVLFLVRRLDEFGDAGGEFVRSLALGGEQLLALLYLGLVASGAGFFLWNFGARRVDPGRLATTNNLKVPTAVLVSVLIFDESLAPSGETSEWVRKLGGMALVLGAVLASGSRTPAPARPRG